VAGGDTPGWQGAFVKKSQNYSPSHWSNTITYITLTVVKSRTKILSTIVIYQKNTVNNHPIDENSTNLVTLRQTRRLAARANFWKHVLPGSSWECRSSAATSAARCERWPASGGGSRGPRPSAGSSPPSRRRGPGANWMNQFKTKFAEKWCPKNYLLKRVGVLLQATKWTTFSS
jgi:hypothetical protein